MSKQTLEQFQADHTKLLDRTENEVTKAGRKYIDEARERDQQEVEKVIKK